VIKLKDRYLFPAIFTYADDGISIEFPDLPGCYPCAHTTEEAMGNAKEALEVHLYGMEHDGEEIPKPCDIKAIELKQNQVVVLIEAWMSLVRDEMENRSVNKNLTIPKWLNDMAEEKKVNFSHVLQIALKEFLGVKGFK